MRATKTDLGSSATFVLRMNSAPRQVCLPAGGGNFDDQGGVARISEILRSYFAPEAADAIYQRAMRFTQFCRADQSIDGFSAGFDFLRLGAESKMKMGAGCPAQFARVLRMCNAALLRQEKSLKMACAQKSLMFTDVPANMRSFFGCASRRFDHGGNGWALRER